MQTSATTPISSDPSFHKPEFKLNRKPALFVLGEQDRAVFQAKLAVINTGEALLLAEIVKLHAKDFHPVSLARIKNIDFICHAEALKYGLRELSEKGFLKREDGEERYIPSSLAIEAAISNPRVNIYYGKQSLDIAVSSDGLFIVPKFGEEASRVMAEFAKRNEKKQFSLRALVSALDVPEERVRVHLRSCVANKTSEVIRREGDDLILQLKEKTSGLKSLKVPEIAELVPAILKAKALAVSSQDVFEIIRSQMEKFPSGISINEILGCYKGPASPTYAQIQNHISVLNRRGVLVRNKSGSKQARDGLRKANVVIWAIKAEFMDMPFENL